MRFDGSLPDMSGRGYHGEGHRRVLSSAHPENYRNGNKNKLKSRNANTFILEPVKTMSGGK